MASSAKVEQIKINGINAGVAGEFFVAAELSRRGHIASITLRNTRGIDILATNSDATHSVNIQVKSSQGRSRSWVMNKKAESYYSDDLFYVFVNLCNLNERPEFFIVPSKVAARYVKNGHIKWLETPGRRGQKHNDTTMRTFSDKDEKYLERWDLLGLE